MVAVVGLAFAITAAGVKSVEWDVECIVPEAI